MSEEQDITAARGLNDGPGKKRPFETFSMPPSGPPETLGQRLAEGISNMGRAEIARLTAELAAWREVGRAIQWNGGTMQRICPSCYKVQSHSQPNEHLGNCKLAALLAKEG